MFGPEHSESISELLYVAAEWHCLAKLRMHTDSTLQDLVAVTVELGNQLRKFAEKIAPDFVTKETPAEAAARARRHAATQKTSTEPISTSSARKAKMYHLNRYKLHALGDYVDMICEFGTTDSYNTQIVSLYD